MLDRRVLTFMQVVQDGSLSKAATSLYLSTVAVKKQIDSLELTVGTRLLNRTSRGVELTAAGKVFYEGAKKLSFLSERTITRARDANLAQRRTVRIGTSFLRPCQPLISQWNLVEEHGANLHLEIIPFDDDTDSMNQMVDSLGHAIDCFVAPCDSDRWRATCNMLILRELPFCLAVPQRHPLAERPLIEWDDLDGETVMMVPGDDSPIVRSIRHKIKTEHPYISLATTPIHFDASVFNHSEQTGCLLQTYEVWERIHPSLVTVPVNWPERMPYGVVYSRTPNEATRAFITLISDSIGNYS